MRAQISQEVEFEIFGSLRSFCIILRLNTVPVYEGSYLQTVIIRLKFVSKQAFFRDTPHMKYLTYNRMMIAIEHLSRGAGECGGWLAGRLKNLGAFVHDTIFTKGTTTTSYNTSNNNKILKSGASQFFLPALRFSAFR